MSPRDTKIGETPAIPTYEEAVSSRPHSARPFQGPTEISADAERQGLLPGAAPGSFQEVWRGNGRYQAVVEDAEEARRSEDSVDFLSAEEHGEERGETDVRREMEQMEIGDPSGPPGDTSRTRRMILPGLSKRIAVITESFSAFRMPRFRFPGAGSMTPHLSDHLKPGFTLLLRIFILLIVVGLVYGVVVMRVVTWKVVPPGQQFVPEAVRGFVQVSMDPENIKKYLYEVTYDDHVAGTKGDYFLAEWVHDRFVDAGLEDVHYDE